MAAKVEIFNLALARLGSEPVLTETEDTKRAIALQSIFDLVRDIVLRDHFWNFAIQRSSLALLATAPIFGYAYAYQLPTDCLRVLGMVGDNANIDPTYEYKVEGRELLTDEDAANIKYISRIEDTGIFDARFVSALASRLAAEVAYKITGSATMKEQMMKEYVQELVAAKAVDGQEDTPEVYESEEWANSRL